MSRIMTEAEKQELLKRAARKVVAMNRPVTFELSLGLTMGLIGQLQLAFRIPENNGPTREMLEKFVRELIKQIDPSEGDIYQLLMLGFNPDYDL